MPGEVVVRDRSNQGVNKGTANAGECLARFAESNA